MPNDLADTVFRLTWLHAGNRNMLELRCTIFAGPGDRVNPSNALIPRTLANS
jgi:hypothetical protein